VFTIHKPEVKNNDIITIVQGEIERIKTEGVTAEEITKVKNQYRLDRFQSGAEGEYASLQTALGKALALAEFTMFDGDPSLINTEIDRYLAITAEQIRDVAKKYFVPANTAVLSIRAANGNSQPAASHTKLR
jgi:predicted Zn-dependent peptidase